MAVTDSPGEGRVWIAEGAGPLDAEPTWTRYDAMSNAKCYGFDCFAGRQSELDTTDTGTANVFFHDKVKALDLDLVGMQILLQLYNPVADTWHIRWRGHIDDLDRDLRDVPSAPDLANVSLSCTGIFDYLGGVKMKPGVFGDVTPAGMNGVVFYEDEPVDDRIIALLTDAGLDPTMRVVFSGNVDVNETLYDTDDVILQAVRDACDAEFPGVANFYEDRYGRAVFHGRFARFDPEATEASASNWDFVRFNAGTREDAGASSAQVREFSYNAPRARIINSYIAFPRADEFGRDFNRAEIQNIPLIREDATSIATYGHRGGDATDLIIKEHKTNGNTGADECELFGEFYVQNYAQPRKAVQNVVFKTHHPGIGDARAAPTWALMTTCDISDAIHLTIDEADLANVPFFVDGIGVSCRPLQPTFDMVTVTPNLTPASYYGTDVFE
jgi:hypothetical protein